jgi:hypothetical protein
MNNVIKYGLIQGKSTIAVCKVRATLDYKMECDILVKLLQNECSKMYEN